MWWSVVDSEECYGTVQMELCSIELALGQSTGAWKCWSDLGREETPRLLGLIYTVGGGMMGVT